MMKDAGISYIDQPLPLHNPRHQIKTYLGKQMKQKKMKSLRNSYDA